MNNEAERCLRACLQKVATGPEYSKDLSFDETREAMRYILEGKADPVQAGVLLIALRMKRETDAENGGALQALRDAMQTATADVDEVVDIAEPYDGYTRSVPVSPFLPAVLAACGLSAVSHGVETVGPKFGATQRKILRAADVDVGLSMEEAATRLADPGIGWAYIDQKVFCPQAHALIDLRARIVKRPVLTTVEVLTGPIRGRRRTHLITGYVHKAYPPVYTRLARLAGFDSAAIVRGVEGGVIPSLRQPTRIVQYHGDGPDEEWPVDPKTLGIEQATRAIPLPDDLSPVENADDGVAAAVDVEALAKIAAEAGMAALRGVPGPARDSLIYGGAIVLAHLGHGSLAEAAENVRRALDSGRAMTRLRASI